jgi:hypothetical protein
MRIIAWCVVVVLVTLGTGGATTAQLPVPWFSLTISVPQSQVRVGSDIRVDVAKKNISDHDIRYSRSPGPDQSSPAGSSYDIIVTNGDGHVMARTDMKPKRPGVVAVGPGSVIGGTLKPGEVLHQYFYANYVCNMSAPGTYTIQISQTAAASPADFRAGRKIVVKSNKLTVTVTN